MTFNTFNRVFFYNGKKQKIILLLNIRGMENKLEYFISGNIIELYSDSVLNCAHDTYMQPQRVR